MVRKRSRSRELALQFLYQVDVQGDAGMDGLDEWLGSQNEDAEITAYARHLIVGTCEHRAGIDAEVQNVARNWDIHRMAIVDRNILRMATYELKFEKEIPPIVAINEAIDLAKRYSTEHSGSFVNGILDRIRLQLPDAGEETPA